MSATGLGVTFWPPASGIGSLPFAGTGGLLYLADRDYTITHIYLHNVSQSNPANVELGITPAGVTMVTDDSRKFLKLTLAAAQMFDLGTRIPFRAGFGLMGTCSIALGDQMVWAGITGEVSD